MMNIKKQKPGEFVITWDEFPEEELHLDFNPLIKAHRLVTGCLLHWQARPRSTKTKQGRCWGVYDLKGDTYFAGVADTIPPFKVGRCRVIDIPEHKFASVPTAVVYFPGSSAFESNQLILIQ